MANIQIETLVPCTGTIRIFHPTQKELVKHEDGTETLEPITLFPLPDGTEGPLELYVVGRNSQQWISYLKKLKVDYKEGKDIDVLSLITQESHKFIASMIIGWLNNGAIDAPYTQEDALELVANPNNYWLLEQIQQYIVDETHFFLKK